MEAEATFGMAQIWMITCVAITVILAVTLHEAAHAWVADKLGDPTPREQGRVTLNPLKHVDLFGTFLLPGMLLLSGTGIVFGWAKPVLVTPSKFKSPKIAMMDVALAGPAMNLLLAVIGCVGLSLFSPNDFVVTGFDPADAANNGFQVLFYFMIIVNVVLAVFNMLPLPPLDGSKVLIGLLPMPLAMPVMRAQKWGFALLIALMFGPLMFPNIGFNPIFAWIAGGMTWLLGVLFSVFGLVA